MKRQWIIASGGASVISPQRFLATLGFLYRLRPHSMHRILIVEDDKALRELLRFVLEEAHFGVAAAQDAVTATDDLKHRRPALILLGWLPPGTSGLGLACQLKRNISTRDIPIIVVRAAEKEDAGVLALECCVDDYVTKPFSSRELVARMRVPLRRARTPPTETVITIGGLCLDVGTQRVTADGQPVTLGPREFCLLHFLMAHPDRVHSRTQLVEAVWGPSERINEASLTVYDVKE